MINGELLKQQLRHLILVGTISFVTGSIFTYLITYQSIISSPFLITNGGLICLFIGIIIKHISN